MATMKVTPFLTGHLVYSVDCRSDFECSLRNRQINQYLDTDTRTWRINDQTLAELENHLQSIINCTQEGDTVLFDVSEVIIPAGRVTIPWRLTLSTAVSSTNLDDGIFPQTETRTAFRCPRENEGVFVIR